MFSIFSSTPKNSSEKKEEDSPSEVDNITDNINNIKLNTEPGNGDSVISQLSIHNQSNSLGRLDLSSVAVNPDDNGMNSAGSSLFHSLKNSLLEVNNTIQLTDPNILREEYKEELARLAHTLKEFFIKMQIISGDDKQSEMELNQADKEKKKPEKKLKEEKTDDEKAVNERKAEERKLDVNQLMIDILNCKYTFSRWIDQGQSLNEFNFKLPYNTLDSVESSKIHSQMVDIDNVVKGSQQLQLLARARQGYNIDYMRKQWKAENVEERKTTEDAIKHIYQKFGEGYGRTNQMYMIKWCELVVSYPYLVMLRMDWSTVCVKLNLLKDAANFENKITSNFKVYDTTWEKFKKLNWPIPGSNTKF